MTKHFRWKFKLRLVDVLLKIEIQSHENNKKIKQHHTSMHAQSRTVNASMDSTAAAVWRRTSEDAFKIQPLSPVVNWSGLHVNVYFYLLSLQNEFSPGCALSTRPVFPLKLADSCQVETEGLNLKLQPPEWCHGNALLLTLGVDELVTPSERWREHDVGVWLVLSPMNG